MNLIIISKPSVKPFKNEALSVPVSNIGPSELTASET